MRPLTACVVALLLTGGVPHVRAAEEAESETDWPSTIMRLRRQLFSQPRYAPARQALATAYNNHGVSLSEQGEFTLAAKQLKEAFKLDEDNLQIQVNLSAVYLQQANEATLVLPKIESAVGVRNAESIMDVEGVDGIVFGPGDLSVKMGFHGQWEHPEVLASMEGVVQGALARGLAVEPPIMPTDRAAYKRELERGIRIFGAMRRSEYDLLKEAANNVMAVYL